MSLYNMQVFVKISDVLIDYSQELQEVRQRSIPSLCESYIIPEDEFVTVNLPLLDKTWQVMKDNIYIFSFLPQMQNAIPNTLSK